MASPFPHPALLFKRVKAGHRDLVRRANQLTELRSGVVTDHAAVLVSESESYKRSIPVGCSVFSRHHVASILVLSATISARR